MGDTNGGQAQGALYPPVTLPCQEDGRPQGAGQVIGSFASGETAPRMPILFTVHHLPCSGGDGTGRRRGLRWCTIRVYDGIRVKGRYTMTHNDFDPPTTTDAIESDDAAGDDEAVDDGGDLGAADTNSGTENASDDPQGIVGEDA